MKPPSFGRRRRSGGFTFLGVLFIVSVLAMTAAMAGVLWSTAQQRENECELVFVGRQFEAAIERYHQQWVGTDQPYPIRLEDLLRDDRLLTLQRYLRRIHADPMTGNSEWGLIRVPGGGIVGVHRLSNRQPFARSTVTAGFAVPSLKSYREWRFVAPSAVELVAEVPK